MATLGEFLSPEAGQARRKWLNETLGSLIAPEVRPWVEAAGEINPVTSMERAGTAAERMTAPGMSGWDRMAAAGDMASNMGAILAPAAVAGKAGVPAANAIVEALTAASPMKGAVGDFAADEYGGLRVFHGSPHDFDKFSMDKIGTGEGAQAYGHGLYFAENEGIARGYRDALTDPDAVPLQFDGRPVNTPWNEEIRERWPDYFKGLSEGDADAMEELLGNLSQVNNMQDVQNVLGGVSSRAKVLYSRIVKPKLVKPDVGSGRMYEVQIDANPEDFLDWDKPLSEQPNVLSRLGYSTMDEDAAHAEAVRIFEENPNGAWMNDPALKARVDELNDMLDRRPPSGTGQDLYRGGASDDVSGILSQMGYGDPAAQSQALRDAGIPGIRYLDAGSRGAGDGSRNYVVFDENLLSIVRKYGWAAAAPMLAAQGFTPEQAKAQYEAQQ